MEQLPSFQTNKPAHDYKKDINYVIKNRLEIEIAEKLQK